MKIAVIGAKGLVGTPVVIEAVKRGHDVDGYTRSGNVTEGATANTIDLTKTADVVDVINNHDFTIITTGGRDNQPAIVQAHKDLIAAAPAGRFLVVGGAGALNAGEGRLYDTPEFPVEYLSEAKAFGEVFDEYVGKAGDLKWTIIAPSPEIAPGEATEYVSALNEPAGSFVSNGTFAVAIVDEAEKAAHIGERFTVANA